MQKSHVIELPAWAVNKATQRLMTVLNEDGVAARFVGGAVRDSLIGRPVTDVDIATTGLAEENVSRLQAAGFSVRPTGLQYGTLTVVIDGQGFEVTTLRRDIETDGRHATVEITDDWMEDARRRDLTMNALYMDTAGGIYDPVGGYKDLLAGRVRFIGTPSDRIAEDYLRILRFFRFMAWYGKGAPDAASLAACKDAAAHITTLSKERITQEMLKLLSAGDPVPVLKCMEDCHVLQVTLGASADLSSLNQLITEEQRWKIEIDPIRRLAALLPEGSSLDVTEKLVLSRRQLHRLAAMLRPPFNPIVCEDTLGLRKQVYIHGAEMVRDILLLHGRGGLAMTAATTVVDRFPLRGRDIIALGMPPGEELGYLLASLEQWWLDQPQLPDRDACLVEARARLSQN